LSDTRNLSRLGKAGKLEQVGESPASSTFAKLLADKVEQTDQAIQTADKVSGDLVVGRTGDIHGTMLALGQADMEFRMLAAVRNKVLDAYREVMRMNF
jgi:flagellar hook-basal body complex protein FliE